MFLLLQIVKNLNSFNIYLDLNLNHVSHYKMETILEKQLENNKQHNQLEQLYNLVMNSAYEKNGTSNSIEQLYHLIMNNSYGTINEQSQCRNQTP